MNHDVIQKQQYMDLIHTRPRTAATPARCDRMSHPCRELGRPAREMTISDRYGKTENKTTAKGGAPRGGFPPRAGSLGRTPARTWGIAPSARRYWGRSHYKNPLPSLRGTGAELRGIQWTARNDSPVFKGDERAKETRVSTRSSSPIAN